MPEKVVCNGLAGKGMTLISADKISNLYYTYLFSGSSTWNNISSCRMQFIFFPLFPTLQHSLEGQLWVPWCTTSTAHAQQAVQKDFLDKGTQQQQHGTESMDEHCDKNKRDTENISYAWSVLLV